MKGGNVIQQIGQELPILVKHADNTGLINGRAVYVYGSDGSNLTVKYASASLSSTSNTTFGIMTEDATGGAKAFCTTFGVVRNINTSLLTEGAPIWIDNSGNGTLTSTRPLAPLNAVFLGVCLRSHATEGAVFVSVQNGYEVNELNDVQNYDSLTLANGSILAWDATNKYWVAQSPPIASVMSSSTGTCSTIRVGVSNVASGNYSSALSGRSNTSSACLSVISGGNNNIASGYNSFVGGGLTNTASACLSVISGGNNNIASGYKSFIGGGFRNCALGTYTTIGGGCYNTASYSGDTVGGGLGNRATTGGSVVGGGTFNYATGYNSTVSGGRLNTSSGCRSTIGGGTINTASATFSSVFSGYCNITNARMSSINGGHRNVIQSPTNECSSLGATIGGGIGHNTTGGTFTSSSGILSGAVDCYSAGKLSTIGGGFRNCGLGAYSTISGGKNNTSCGCFSFVGGGFCNNANGSRSMIGGGYCNVSSLFSTISGGNKNLASGSWSFIGGGRYNVSSGLNSVTSGGSCNSSTGGSSTVSGGANNVASGIFSTISGGATNTASGYFSAITGNLCSTNNARFSVINGGHRNTIQSPINECCSLGVAIGGGIGHNSSGGTFTPTNGCLSGAITCCNAGKLSTIGGGLRNCALGLYSVISGGRNNTASGYFSSVGGGFNNTASGNRSSVGGAGNTASGESASVLGGILNTASGIYSTILGGNYNTASGEYSSVLGGFNNIASCFNSHIIGSGLTSSAPNTTFVQGLSKTSGTFRIKHPDPDKNQTHYLQHSFVESPTAGDNIYRYVAKVINGFAEIELPDYFKFLNENTQIWVTSKEGYGIGFGKVNTELTKVTIFANEDLEYNVLIIATRKDKDAVENWNGIEILQTKK